MALEFIHVKLLKYSHRPVILNAGLRVRIEKRITITGRLADGTNTSGVSALFAKESRVLAAATDYDEIILNGISFGSGKIENIIFAGGVMVRDEDYTYEISCYEEGNLFNASSGVYTGITWTDSDKIESLNESLQYEDNERGDRTYNHSVDVKFTNYSSVADGTNKAKALAAVFFNATSGLGAFLNTYAAMGTAKKLYTESYNIIDCSSSFTETVVIPRERSGNYSYSLSYQINQGEDGFVTVSEKCDIKGLTNPRLTGALEGMAALSAGVYTRVAAVYSAYAFSSATLFSNPIQKNVTVNKFTGEIGLESSFSNDPKYQHEATWEYILEASKEASGYYTVSEAGSVVGHGRPLVDKFQNAQTFYDSTVRPNIATRVAAYYLLVSGRSLSLLKVAESKSQDEYAGSIRYGQTFTDNNLYSDGDIRRTDATITVSRPTHITQKYAIFNQKELVQPQSQSSLGTVSYQVRLKGKRGTPLATYLTSAKAVVSSNLPATSDRFIESVQYQFSPRVNEFDMSLTIKYAGSSKAFTDITLD